MQQSKPNEQFKDRVKILDWNLKTTTSKDKDDFKNDLFYELKKCQCPFTNPLPINGLINPYETRVRPHCFDLDSIGDGRLVHEWTSNATGWCPKRLEVIYKDVKVLYIAIEEKGSVIDILTVHDNEADAVLVTRNIIQQEDPEADTSHIYVVRYEHI